MMHERQADLRAQGATRRTTTFALLSAVVAGVVALAVVAGAKGEGWIRLTFAAAIAAFAVSWLLWWGIAERPRTLGALRGATIGALTGALSHLPCWYLAILGEHVFALIAGTSSEHRPGPLDALGGAVALSIWSLLLVGWLTVPAGGILGALFARWAKRRIADESAD